MVLDGRAVDERGDQVDLPACGPHPETPLPWQRQTPLDRSPAVTGLDHRRDVLQRPTQVLPTARRGVDHHVEIMRTALLAGENSRHGPDHHEPAPVIVHGVEHVVEHRN